MWGSALHDLGPPYRDRQFLCPCHCGANRFGGRGVRNIPLCLCHMWVLFSFRHSVNVSCLCKTVPSKSSSDLKPLNSLCRSFRILKIKQASSLFVVPVSEIASKRRRASLGIVYNMSYPIGQMIVPVVAYFIRDWRTLQIILSVPAIFILIFWWWVAKILFTFREKVQTAAGVGFLTFFEETDVYYVINLSN